MRYVSLEDRIYTAGLVDGEGCISITRVKRTGRSQSDYHHLFFSLESTDPSIAYWLQERFGGSVHIDTTKVKDNHQTTYRWKLGTQDTLHLLRLLLPYLRIKQPQAELGLEFALQRDIQKTGRQRTLPEAEIGLRESFYRGMKALNSRGPARM